MSNQNHTKEFFELIKAIGETKSKQEEDKIIVKELGVLKQNLNNTKVTLKLMKEYIVRVLYCEMLGHDASFGYIYAIKLTSSKVLLEKRVGYLAVSLCVPKDHELLLLIIATLQRDLQSTNYLEVCCALSAATKLVSPETIPALLDHVLRLKKHSNLAVKKKVITLLHTFHTLSPGCVPDIVEHAKDAMCDDPSVMGASLGLFYDLAQDPEYLPKLKELVSGFVHILKQIKDHKFPKDYDYHRLPAPWIQVKLLKILALLGKDDRGSSELMYDTLREAMTRADIGINIGHALVYECVTTLTTIYPSSTLLEQAAAAISRFITSSNHNLKYLGIRALTEIVKINPKYASQHQMVVIDCLEDPDETLKRRTLSLLYTMTNAANATTIVKKLLEFARKSLDNHMRKELVVNINSLAEQFTPNIFWYIDTMNALLEIGPEFVPPSGIQNMMSVISLGAGDDDEKDEEMRRYCVDTFFEILDTKSVVHDLHLHVISWVLGEYGYKSEQYSQTDILELLCDVADRQLEEEETRCWIVSAMMKLVAHTGGMPPPSVEAVLHKYKNSKNVDLQQRCYEFLSLINCCNDNNRDQIMETVLPPDGSCIEVEVDEHMSFLQDIVDQMIDRGYKPYVPQHMREEMEQQATKKRSELKYKEYEKPTAPVRGTLHDVFVPKPTSADEMNQRSVDTSHQEHSYYPSSLSGELSLSVLKDKERIWRDEEDQPVIAPSPYTPSQPSYPQFDNRSRSSSNSSGDAPVQSLSKQDRPVDVIPKKSKHEKLRKNIFDGPSDFDNYKKPTKKAPTTRKRGSSKSQIQPPTTNTGDSNDMWNMMNIKEQPQQAQTQQGTEQKSAQQARLTLQEKLKQKQNQNQQSAPQQATQSKNNLLEFDEIFGPPTTGTKSSPVVQQNPNDLLFEMTNEYQPQQQSPSFDEMLMPASTSPTKTVKSSPSPLNLPKSQTGILIALAQEAQKANGPVTLAQDDLIEVTCEKYWREDTTVFALQFKTNRGYTLSSLQCQFQAPSKFNMRYQYDSNANAIQRGNSISFPRLQPGEPNILLVEVQLSELVGFGTSLMGTINYADQNKKSKIVSITAPIDLVDVLRPVNLEVSQFGSQWVSYSHENKIQIKGAHNIQSYSDKIATLNIQVIQAIKSEIISAARIIGHGDTLCLVHAKLLQQGVALTVKSKDKTLCEHICRAATRAFAQ